MQQNHNNYVLAGYTDTKEKLHDMPTVICPRGTKAELAFPNMTHSVLYPA